jgi:hypothetical protein
MRTRLIHERGETISDLNVESVYVERVSSILRSRSIPSCFRRQDLRVLPWMFFAIHFDSGLMSGLVG